MNKFNNQNQTKTSLKQIELFENYMIKILESQKYVYGKDFYFVTQSSTETKMLILHITDKIVIGTYTALKGAYRQLGMKVELTKPERNDGTMGSILMTIPEIKSEISI